MDATLHTIIATGSLLAAFYAGKYFSPLGIVSDAIEKTLDRLEREGYIETRTDK